MLVTKNGNYMLGYDKQGNIHNIVIIDGRYYRAKIDINSCSLVPQGNPIKASDLTFAEDDD